MLVQAARRVIVIDRIQTDFIFIVTTQDFTI
jgi:hypothetical protein